MKNKIKTNENTSKVKFVNKSKMICKFFVCCLSFVILIVCCLTIFNYTNNTQTSLAENNLSSSIVVDAENNTNNFFDNGQGDGLSSKTAFQISSYNDLSKLANLINSEVADNVINGSTTFRNAYYKLINNVSNENANENWMPIGVNSTYYFSGNFNGQGYTIKLIASKMANSISGGVFGYTKGVENSNCVIENICVEWVGEINIVSTASNVTFYYGGVVGIANGYTLINSCFTENYSIKAELSSVCYVGGIVGNVITSTIKNCYSKNVNIDVATIVSSKPAYAGGIVGRLYTKSSLSNCYLIKGKINAENSVTNLSYAGGICGAIASNIANCFVLLTQDCEIKGGGDSGNIVGNRNVSNTVSYCYYNINDKTKNKGKYVSTLNNLLVLKDNLNYDEIKNNYIKKNSTIPWSEITNSWDFVKTWEIDADINDGLPYLKDFYGNVTFDPNYVGLNEKVEQFKIGEEIVLSGDKFTSGGNDKIKGWLVDGDRYNVGDTITVSNGMVLEAIWGQGCSVNFEISTNVGVIIKIYKTDTELQQVFIDKTENANYYNFNLDLENNKTYKVVISAFYTANITLENEIENKITLYSNVLTINTEEASSLNILLKIVSFSGNNGVIV